MRPAKRRARGWRPGFGAPLFRRHVPTLTYRLLRRLRAPPMHARLPQQTRFQTMSDSIIGRIDEMGSRIDDLEKSIGELIQQAGVEEADASA